MTLNPQQITNTINELQENFELSGLTKQQVATDLNISLNKLDTIMNLNQESLNDPWIVRNYLIDKVRAKNQEPVPFTALAGDWHHYWFLNSRIIDKRKITAGDN
ncbi:DUF2316 family protein [Companilactobacillus kimchiensis]|uniref:DUF2316 family protein n=1 Tax=Companilactobacillus kimchiensis TaxID=993692 RepID=A0A0R2LBS7_9LACO|nr:DUF2316 family protein [Companilactobacillus kimchiensis]KRN99283.1 hypothetical protein IV57_GL000339 [Companilactobacillus kimchiensis]